MSFILGIITAVVVLWVAAALQGACLGVVLGYFLTVLADAIRARKMPKHKPEDPILCSLRIIEQNQVLLFNEIRRFQMSVNNQLDQIVANEQTELSRLQAIQVAVEELKAQGVDVSKIEAALAGQAAVSDETAAIEGDLAPAESSSSSPSV